jgi:murein DD-endopeptidase MepM/ murein hydrolase activator NlpD
MRLRIVLIGPAIAVLALAPRGSAAAVDYVKPVPGPIVRHFEAPSTPYGAGHRGIDIETPEGSTVIASGGGVVAFAGQVGGSLFVSIDHPDGIRTTYSFLEAILVRVGQAVRRGDPIARSGPGHPGVTPPHLHFGMRIGSEYVDPEPFLVASLRHDQSGVLRLAPLPEGETVAARARVGRAALPALAVALAIRPRGRRTRGR